MKIEMNIKDAINRSISHNEIVRVDVANLAEALIEVSRLTDDYDNAVENDGSADVWGTTEYGGDFRIRITVATA